ncbi:major facilitator superfamily domain-containing protein [Aspergillus heterothallicus]
MANILDDDRHDVPGTVRLVDINASESDIVLVPRPSSDPNDPLNWSYRRKLLAVSMAYLYVMGTGIATSLQYSVLADIEADTGISTANLPLALTYGRRGVYLVTMLLTVPIMVWTAYSTSAGEWFAHRVLIGIVVSPIESLCEVTVFDLFFAHNRGTYMGLYVFILFGSNFLAPLVAGWFNDAYGWRWTMHFGAILCAVCFFVMFFFMEETIYFRDAIIEGEEDVSVSRTTNSKEQIPSPSPPTSFHPATKSRRLSRYSLFRSLPGRPSDLDMLRMVYRPVLMIFHFPTVAWAGFLYGINLAWYNVLNGTASPVLTGAPYNWSAALVGCVYSGPIIGAALGSLWSGKVADKIALHLARRNKGIREPEHRLWVLPISGLISAAGLITWGVGASRSIHWAGLVFGLGMLTFGVVTGGAIAVSYNVDCFKEIAGETTVSVMVIRNTIGFAFSYAITPWWTGQGLQNCFITAAMISIACTCTFGIVIVYGKRIRRWSAPAYRRYLATTVVRQE